MKATWARGLTLCVGLVALGCGADKDDGGGANAAWREPANQVNDATCDKTYECFSAATLDVLRKMEPRLGQTVDECKSNFRAANSHATQPCPPGETFQKANAEQCVTELTALTCPGYLSNPKGPAACTQICSTGGPVVPACSKPTTKPAAIELPDGGSLPLFQRAIGQISGAETDTFVIPLDCTPGYGFQVTVNPKSADLNIALTYDIAGLHSDLDDQGPGTGEGSTLVANSNLSLPNELVVGVSAVGGGTGDYEITVSTNP